MAKEKFNRTKSSHVKIGVNVDKSITINNAHKRLGNNDEHRVDNNITERVSNNIEQRVDNNVHEETDELKR